MNQVQTSPVIAFVIRHRRWFIFAAHSLAVCAAYTLAHLIRFEFGIPPTFREEFWTGFLLVLVVRTAFFIRYRLFSSLWRYTSMDDLLAIIKATTMGSLVLLAAIMFTFGGRYGRSVFLLDWVLCIALLAGMRFSIRALREWQLRASEDVAIRTALIVGAGDAGQELMRTLRGSSAVRYRIVGFLDDDPHKRHLQIRGVRVVGTTADLPRLTKELGVEEILVAAPSAGLEETRRIMRMARECATPVRTVPSLRDLISGRARVGDLQRVEPEDLLGRDVVTIDDHLVRGQIRGEVVLVTGAAGSIGSEICRQVAGFEPRLLVLYERAESNLYFAAHELHQRFPALELVSVIGDIQDRDGLAEIFDRYRPSIVYHAAAYKHVPLMEGNPLEAIVNNVFGTECVMRVAVEHGVERLVHISTDKAVAPVGIMGVTKRVSEGLILALDSGRTTCSAVRFGNVLGSDGSVLPLLRWQISMGAPLTITHEEASRFFMLISEAAQLVLQAGAMATGGEIYFLDMGEPVKIFEMANDLVRLSGLRPQEDVPMQIIGLRPGERLTEELVREQERLLPTDHERIRMAQKIDFRPRDFLSKLEILRSKVDHRNSVEAVAALRQLADMC